jgi:hypothetical protein
MLRTPGENRMEAISLTARDGALRVVAVDCGQVINPDPVAACR